MSFFSFLILILLYNCTAAFENLRQCHLSLEKKQVKGKEKKTNEHNIESKIIDKIWYGRTYKQFFTRAELYRPFFLISFLSIIQQFSGMSVIRAYVVQIFRNLGIYVNLFTIYLLLVIRVINKVSGSTLFTVMGGERALTASPKE